MRLRPRTPRRGLVLAWQTTAPTPGATWMQREPTAISLVAMATPSMPVRSHRPISENVVNRMPGSINATSATPRARARPCRDPDSVSPRVDPRVLLAVAPSRRGRRAQAGHDPPPRLSGVDHLVDLEEGGGVEPLAALVHARHHLLVLPLPLGGVRDRRQLVSVAELHRALEAHAAELARRPGHR